MQELCEDKCKSLFLVRKTCAYCVDNSVRGGTGQARRAGVTTSFPIPIFANASLSATNRRCGHTGTRARARPRRRRPRSWRSASWTPRSGRPLCSARRFRIQFPNSAASSLSLAGEGSAARHLRRVRSLTRLASLFQPRPPCIALNYHRAETPAFKTRLLSFTFSAST